MKNIKNQLKFGTVKVFGYDQHERGEGENLDITELDVYNHLEEYQVDIDAMICDMREIRLEQLEEDLEFEDITEKEYNREVEILENTKRLEDFTDIEYGKSGNSYNWGANAVINWEQVRIFEESYIKVRFHKYGDVRSNYTDYMYIRMEELEFLESLYEIFRSVVVEINREDYNINHNFMREGGVVNIQSDNIDIDEVFIEADFSDLESIKNGVIEVLEDEGVL